MTILIVLFISHFIADFILQSRTMAEQKSKNLLVLMDHCAIQFSVMFALLLPFQDLNIQIISMLALANSGIHGLIDWYIWKGYKWITYQRLIRSGKGMQWCDAEELKSSFKYWEDHRFYTFIGLDQLLHGITIIILWGMFT